MRRPHIEHLLDPRSLAIVGANDKGNSGARAIKGAIASRFKGPIYPVNPNYESLEGLKCYPSLAALPEVPDSVVVSVPTSSALKVLAEGEAAGVRCMLFFSGGFTDAGTPEGQRRHDEMMEIASRSGMIIGGPNCMGVLSLRRNFDSSFVSTPGPLKTGGISIVSQSGGLINAFTELGYARDLGFNYLISAGNEAVVNAADHLDWLADDDGTKVIVSCLESVKDGPRYRAALARATARKPVIILKLGRSDAGQQAALAHTGSLAGSDEVFCAVCAQHGAIMVDTIDQALEAAAMFERLPLPGGDNIVIFSTSGGAAVLATDLATTLGMSFPGLTPATNARMQQIYGAKRPFINPFDVGSYPLMATDDNMTQTLKTLIADDEVHMIACVMVVQRDLKGNRMGLFNQIKAVIPASPKPFALIPEATMHWRDAPPDVGAHLSGSLYDGLVGLRALRDYAAFRRRAKPTAAPAGARIEIPRVANRSVLTEFESKRVLARAGMPVTREELAGSADSAVAAAARLGYPLALKIQSPDLMHKTEAGGVILDIADEAVLRAAWARLATIAKDRSVARLDGMLVQEMAPCGVEFLLGMKRDPVFGPVLVAGPGGVFLDLLGKEARLRLPPFGIDEARAMLSSSSVAEKLLAGFRGQPEADREALARLVADFADFASRLGQDVVAIDLNPVMVLPRGQGVRIVDASFEFAPA